MLKRFDLVALPCRITRSGFTSERVFRLRAADGGEYTGAADVMYFFDEERKPVPAEPPPRGVILAGMVSARVVEQSNGTVLLSVPSGDVVRVATTDLVSHPPRPEDRVPLQP